MRFSKTRCDTSYVQFDGLDNYYCYFCGEKVKFYHGNMYESSECYCYCDKANELNKITQDIKGCKEKISELETKKNDLLNFKHPKIAKMLYDLNLEKLKREYNQVGE